MMSDEINILLLPHHLNYSLWQVLYVIRIYDGCTSIEIAEYLNVSKPSIAKRIQILMQLEVLQQIMTEDKRQKKLILSPYGEELFDKCSVLIDQFEDQLIQKFDAEQINQTNELFLELIQRLKLSKSGNHYE